MAVSQFSVTPTTYSEAVNALKGRESKKIANHTYLVALDNGDIAIRHHWTDIITFHEDNTATIDCGGWRSPSTRDRLRHMGVHIVQANRQWYLDGKPFENGVRIKCPLDVPEWRRKTVA